MNKNIFSVYKIPAYSVKKEDYESCKYEGDVASILKRLEKNKGYHLKINPDKPCKFYGDFDHCSDPKEFFEFLSIFHKLIGVKKEDISYTESKNNKGEWSYHYVIPSLETTPSDLKYFFETKCKDYFTKFKDSYQLDTGVYGNVLFRLPNQTNKNKLNVHEIKQGKMIDFIVEDVEDCDARIKYANKEVAPKSPVKPTIKTADEDILKHSEICLECIDYNDYNDWTKTGMILKNILPDEGFDLWLEFSSQYSKFKKDECVTKWNSYKNDGGLNLGSLVYMAKENNLDLYNELMTEWKPQPIKPESKKEEINFHSLSTSSIADHFKSKFSNKFIFQNDRLYFYNGVYWQCEDKKNLFSLNNFLSGEYFDYLFNLFQIEEKKQYENMKDDTKEKMDKIKGQLCNLKNYDKRQKYIADILLKLNNPDVQFDNNPYLFAFNNKIYDLEKSQFIEPKFDQYVSMTTGYKYIDNDHEEKAKIDEINKLIDTIFPDPEIKKLYLTILSTGMDGKALELFVIANGSGGNGKGLLNEFVFNMLGNYAYILPSTILLNPLKSNGANVEVANANRKRLVIAREPDAKFKINTSTLRELTGGEEINARGLYSDNTKVNLNLSFVMECNDKPKLDEINDAMSRRILDIPFKNRFVDQYVYDELDEEDKKTTFLVNSDYKGTEFKVKYRQALFKILCDHHQAFLKNKRVLPKPKEIIQRNKEYLQSSDEMLSWFNDNYDKTDNKKDIIKLKSVYDKFKDSEFFHNCTKQQKRDNNYKTFVEKLQNNIFLRKYVTIDSKNVNIITNYVIKKAEEFDDDDDKVKSALDI